MPIIKSLICFARTGLRIFYLRFRQGAYVSIVEAVGLGSLAEYPLEYPLMMGRANHKKVSQSSSNVRFRR